MKVLYIGRLFSGLETSLMSRVWRPTGVPTIHKVIERFDRDAELRIILANKDDARLWREKSDVTLALAGLRAPVTVLAGSSSRGGWNGIWREANQTLRIFMAVWRWRPDLIYIDHGNAIAAGILARLRLGPVVFRVMGIYPAMREALSGRRLGFRALRWAYRAPFALVICSQDGSGGTKWLKQALRPGIRTEIMLNGVDLPDERTANTQFLSTLPNDRTIVLFVGKLERQKGCQAFIDGFLRARAQARGQLYAVVVGAGSQAETLKRRVRDGNAEADVTFIERVPHSDILAIQRRADVYVSLNRLGNFSNANLEAMRVGACIVLPAQLPEVGADDPTESLLPSSAYARIPHPDASEELASAILRLHRDPDERRRLAGAMQIAAARLLQTWDERVTREMELLYGLFEEPECTTGAAPARPS